MKKAITWCYLAALVGVLFAGGYCVLKKQQPGKTPKETVQEDSSQETAPDDPERLLYAIYEMDYRGYSNGQGAAVSYNSYAKGVNDFFIGRLTSDSAYWNYYDRILTEYPALEPQVFTAEEMQEMLDVSQNGFEVVIEVCSPEIAGDEESRYAVALGLTEDSQQFEQLSSEEKMAVKDAARCAMRDSLYLAVNDYIAHNSLIDPNVAQPVRAAARYEEMMSRNSVPDGGEGKAAAGNQTHVSKKELVLVFLLGAALAEGIALSFAILSDTIVSTDSLRHNTNLSVLGTIDQNNPDYSEAALRVTLQQINRGELALVYVDPSDIQIDPVASGLQTALTLVNTCSGKENEDISVPAFACNKMWEPRLIHLSGKKVIVVVKAGKTKISALRKTAKMLEVLQADVVGAIVLT